MATMKDLLRAETLKVGSRGAMPSNQIIALVEKTNFTSPNGESVRYVAPCDGVLSAFLQAAGRDGDATPGGGIVDGDGRGHAARTTDGSVHMNLRKGNSATVSFYEAREHIDQWIVRFFKTIGGAKSPVAQLFWRVVPCLRNCLARVLTPIADRTRASSQGAILQQISPSRRDMRTPMQIVTSLRATACSLFSVNPLKATPTTTSRFDEISSTVGSLGATGRRGRFLRLLAERAKRFTGTQGLMEPLRTLRRTSAFTHTSALNVCFGGLA